MKSLLPLLILTTIIFLSCSKSERLNEVNPSYVGAYNSTSGDTVYVSKNGTFAKIKWSPKNLPPIVFDSVFVASDLTFTDNETVSRTFTWFPYNTVYYHSIGTGHFGNNTIDFHFNISGDIFYSGVKQP